MRNGIVGHREDLRGLHFEGYHTSSLFLSLSRCNRLGVTNGRSELVLESLLWTKMHQIECFSDLGGQPG